MIENGRRLLTVEGDPVWILPGAPAGYGATPEEARAYLKACTSTGKRSPSVLSGLAERESLSRT